MPDLPDGRHGGRQVIAESISKNVLWILNTESPRKSLTKFFILVIKILVIEFDFGLFLSPQEGSLTSVFVPSFFYINLFKLL